jgi:hypothetical protein
MQCRILDTLRRLGELRLHGFKAPSTLAGRLKSVTH